MVIFGFALLTVGVLALISFSIIFSNNKYYCFVFEHKEWKIWEDLIKRKDELEFDEYYAYEGHPELENYKFKSTFNGEEVMVILWMKNGAVSVHSNDRGCILCDFDIYHVEIMRGILERKLEELEVK